MSITRVGSDIDPGDFTTSAPLVFANAPIAGDAIVLFAGCGYGYTVPTPSGYTALGSVQGSSAGSYTRLYAFAKIATGVETGVTITPSGGIISCAMSTIWRGSSGSLAWAPLMTSANQYATYGGSYADGPAWASLPTDQVAATVGLFCENPSYWSTSSSISGSGWTSRANNRLDGTGYGSHRSWLAQMATNTTETLIPARSYFTTSSTTGIANCCMVYVYENTGKRSKLILGM